MVIVYNLLFALLVFGPTGVIFWQLIKPDNHKYLKRVTVIGLIILALISLEIVIGKSGQTALVVEKIAAIFMLVSSFNILALITLKSTKNRLLLLSLIVAIVMTVFFGLAGYRNLLEAWCYVFGQQCFSNILMYGR